MEVRPGYTPIGALDMAYALREAHVRALGQAPTMERLGVAWAQCAVETGTGARMRQRNFGNIAAGKSWSGDYYALKVPPPDPPTMRFRAYATHADGAVDYWHVIATTFGAALPAFDAGDPHGAAEALGKLRYFLADLGRYAGAMAVQFTYWLDVVRPAMEALDVLDDSKPWRDPHVPLGERCVLLSLHELETGVCESPPGSNTGPRIRLYFAPAYRLETGELLGIKAGAWCAAAACWVARQCSRAGETVPHPYVASGLEIETATKRNGCWRPVEKVRERAWLPRRGDLVISTRPGEAWFRHVSRVEREVDASGDFRTIDGNHGADGRWALVERNSGDTTLLGFVTYADED